MPRLIDESSVVTAAGNKPKRIEEYAGRVSSGHQQVSIARMISPGGWEEPAQQPEFEEITVVLRGTLRVESDGGVLEVQAGQAGRSAQRKLPFHGMNLESWNLASRGRSVASRPGNR